MPEVLEKRGTFARRLGPNEIRCFQRIGAQLDEEFGPARWLESGRYIDRQLVTDKGVSLPDMQRALAQAVLKCPGVIAAYTSTELLSDTELDAMGEIFRRSHHATRSPDVEILVEENALFTSAVASHGTPYRYDTHVPLLLRIPGVEPQSIDQRVRTIDLAPTLAGYLGLEMVGKVDGEDLRSLYDPSAASQTSATETAAQPGSDTGG
jgi:hypothetical protein